MRPTRRQVLAVGVLLATAASGRRRAAALSKPTITVHKAPT
ncbi:MAG: hypothetical protein ACREKS_02785 [Candidatus Rokuibacteriota bacterium]